MKKKCETCKWGVIGRFNRLYGGMPLGCCKPAEKQEKWNCYEAKAKRN